MPTPIKAYLGTVPLFDNGQSSTGYVRPIDWLELPSAPAQGVHGLLAVHPNDKDKNLVAILAEGPFTVDWGNGIVQNFSSNATAQYQYDYDLLPANTLSSRGYKQVVIKVTPQSGWNLTRCTISQRHTGWGTSSLTSYSVNWLDLSINLPNLGAGSTLSISNTLGQAVLLERVNITSWGGITNISNLFVRCKSLQSLNETEWNLSNVTSMNLVFQQCELLESLDCSSWDVSKIGSATSFLNSCINLKSFKAKNWNLSSCSSFAGFFDGCNSLEYCEIENWQLRQTGTLTISNIFQNCTSLRSVDLSAWNVSRAITLSATFNQTKSWLDFSSISNWQVSNVTNMISCFAGTGAEEIDISGWDISNVTTVQDLFNSCSRLRTVKLPAWPTAATILVGNSFCLGNTTLQNFSVTGPIRNTGTSSLNFSNCSLGSSELNYIYAQLADYTGQTGKTINVTNNYGTTSDDPSIATAKNWTVTG